MPPGPHPAPGIRILTADEIASRVSELGALLHACVHAGASINFVLPFTQAEAETFWCAKVYPAVRDGVRVVLVAQDGGRIVGSVQLGIDTPPNQSHRAEVTKLMVHPEVRRQGIGLSLMQVLEGMTGSMGRRLLTLDTRSGDAAERLYRSLGYTPAGQIPDFCRDPFEDRLDSTTIMYKQL